MNKKPDPLMTELRKSYLKKGPDPGRDINRWAEDYMNGIGRDVKTAERLIHQKVPIEEISRQTGLRKDTIESLYSSNKKKKKEISHELHH